MNSLYKAELKVAAEENVFASWEGYKYIAVAFVDNMCHILHDII